MESILEVLTPDNLVFIFKGFGLTLYISLIAIILSTIISTVLAVMRNGKNPILRIISSIYIEFVRNVPNLLWIFTIDLFGNCKKCYTIFMETVYDKAQKLNSKNFKLLIGVKKETF
ncbi:ABC transporter permease subunit, partial [Streptococcus pneumoniae]|nr:ABC transporter permease subunit [Streptococcus pneumoniae]